MELGGSVLFRFVVRNVLLKDKFKRKDLTNGKTGKVLGAAHLGSILNIWSFRTLLGVLSAPGRVHGMLIMSFYHLLHFTKK